MVLVLIMTRFCSVLSDLTLILELPAVHAGRCMLTEPQQLPLLLTDMNCFLPQDWWRSWFPTGPGGSGTGTEEEEEEQRGGEGGGRAADEEQEEKVQLEGEHRPRRKVRPTRPGTDH